ncbi:Bug family tripartite tricarboxylate transporter substrate binding protein [Neoroseomonas soli]|uniref:Tripartite tricarboxylate transporter substrate binding protein n=1 Tax=Neoroseomonas soli TaxID=1081025 RepID=A0A9X9WY22_9PROT|nr:tripartite tricarboxylate transporter substrate binding protein [Neoroseomonas soli]MBR0672051.1 tripartite tricarboxylate transporter substrate binding protein [Neoroseomonas soli]
MTSLNRRSLLAASGLLAAPGLVRAQGNWPQGQATSLVIPYAAGGSPDVLGRIITQGFAERSGGTFIMDHKPGASTTLAARHVARARPDGTTLLMGTIVTFTMAPYALRSLGYDPINDFAHITQIAETLFIMVAHPRWESLDHVLSEARRRPGQLTYATWGVGSTSHLGMVDLMQRTGTEMLHVPFNGTPPALTETIAGRTDVMISTFAPAKPHVESGRLRALGMVSAARTPALPDVPTMTELGQRDFVLGGWFSLQAPSGTPRPILDRVNDLAKEAFATPATAEAFARLGFARAEPGPEALMARIRRELDQNKDLMRRAGIQPE